MFLFTKEIEIMVVSGAQICEVINCIPSGYSSQSQFDGNADSHTSFFRVFSI